jgi:predicted acetyltransferase
MEFRTIAPEEADEFFTTLERAFGNIVANEDEVAHEMARLQHDRLWAALEDGRIVGCAGAYSWETHVPGGAAVPTAGITTVGVLPTHRRRGITTQLMWRLLRQAREREEPLATLFASEGAIYGRFGFGVSSQHLDLDVLVDRARFVPGLDPYGSVRLLPRDQALPLLHPVYEQVASTRPGMVRLDRDGVDWVLEEKKDPKEGHFYAVHLDDGGRPDAYAVYRVKHEWPESLPHVELVVRDLLATHARANAAMWRYLFDVDLVSRVLAENRPPDEPLRWQLAEPRAARAKVFDGLYARPVDVAAALACRAYAADGRLAVGVHDPFAPENDGVYVLSVEGGVARCTRVDADPDLRCRVNALGSVLLGGTTWSVLAAAGAVEAISPRALERADAMFVTPFAAWAPWWF